MFAPRKVSLSCHKLSVLWKVVEAWNEVEFQIDYGQTVIPKRVRVLKGIIPVNFTLTVNVFSIFDHHDNHDSI